MNSRPPPDQLAKIQVSQVNSWCRYDPLVCVTAVATETAFIAVAYTAVLFLLGNAMPGVPELIKFVLIFGFVSLAARMVSDDLGNKLSIAAVSGLGGKIATLLAPRIVGW